MKGFVFWVLVCVAAFLSFSTDGTTSSVPDAHLTRHGNDMTVLQNRKLKDNGQAWGPEKIDDAGDTNMSLEDYNHIDPVPSSKASIKPAPIQHGTPFMPYLPKPAPGPPPKA